MEQSAAEGFSSITMDPWDVPCEPNAYFVEESRMFEMPHTTQLSVRKENSCKISYIGLYRVKE